jgi:hypothetical protein
MRSLLTACTPAILQPQQLGQVRITIGVPTTAGGLVDGVLDYEQISCRLAETLPPELQDGDAAYPSLTRCRGPLHTLGYRINLADAIALLNYGGFQEDQIQRILHLPWDGWHRSWWNTLSPQGRSGLPFQRWFRSRAYGDGTYTLQYRDHYPQDAPLCFRGQWQRIPLAIHQPQQDFGNTLLDLRAAQQALGGETALLLHYGLSALQSEGFMRQGISLYPLQGNDPTPVACDRCQSLTCPLQGQPDTPVTHCRRFQPSL